MNDNDLCWMSAFDLAAAIAKKKVSPVEVVDATLARIDKLKELNAYVTLDADGARKAAKAAERAVGQRGVKLGPLHGVPFSVKDLIITKGNPSALRDGDRRRAGRPRRGKRLHVHLQHDGPAGGDGPCGFTKAGLPIGLQIIGRRFDDVTVLRASAAFEAAPPWAQQRPGIG